MRIAYQTGDLGFSSSDLDGLRRELEEFFAGKGVSPKITKAGDHLVAEIDDATVEEAETRVKLAFDCCNRGNFSSAREFIEGALKICPVYSDAYRTLAQIEMQEGRSEEAVRYCPIPIRPQNRQEQ